MRILRLQNIKYRQSNNMFLLLKLYFDICLMRANTEEIPDSRFLLATTLVAHFLVGVLSNLIDFSLAKSVLMVFISLLMTVGLAIGALWAANLSHRVPQTLTALAGTGIILYIISLPFRILSYNFPPEQLMFPVYMLLMILFWKIAIIGHILKNALAIPYWATVTISIVFVFTEYRVILYLLHPVKS